MIIVLLREMIAELEARTSTDQHELRSEYAQLSTELELDIARALLRYGDTTAT